MDKNDVKQSVNIWDDFFWGSSKYERNGSRANLKWRSSGVIYFACDQLRSYFDEGQKNEIYFLSWIYSTPDISENISTVSPP